MNMTRAQRDTLPDRPEPKTQRLQTMPNGVVVARRRFYEAVDNGVRWFVVAAYMQQALGLLSDRDLTDCEYLTVTEIREESARGIRIRPGDDCPAETLADAPMGSVFCNEE